MSGNPNLHTVAVNAEVPAVKCHLCGHRAVVGKDVLPVHEGNMKQVSSLRLKCSKCGSTSIGWLIPFTTEDAIAWLGGEELRAAFRSGA